MPSFSSLMNNLSAGIFALVTIPFVLVALFLLWRALSSRRKVRESMNWEKTTGTVLFSMVETRRSRSSEGGTSTSYYPKVVYEYRVMGQVYHGDRFSLGEIGLGFYNRVATKVAEYPAGKLIDVYYNPENPLEAVLERTAPSSNILIFVVILIFGILACSGVMMVGGFALVNQFISGMIQTLPQ